MGLLDGKVVLITGAGGGIGRAHALACAREGARVVVNDLGGSRDGSGAGRSMADEVVAEIEALGGEAVADYGSVTDPEAAAAMVGAAVQRWGRLDTVVNNAGILRDRTFAKMTEAEWDAVIAVHLTGTRNVVRAALPALSAGGGAIVNTTSYSGLIGNFGQSNYGAAKAGIYGFTRVLALELRKHGITANCVAPVAKTRMTEGIAMVEDDWGPEHIAPVVVFLASDLARGVTGQVFGVQGQRLHVYEMHTSEGVTKPGTEPWTAAEIAERLEDIRAFAPAAPAVVDEGDEVSRVFSHLPAGFRPAAAAGWTAVLWWKVAGGTDQTILVADGACEVRAGLHGSPTCTVEIGADTLIAIFRGELEAAKAFMGGKAKADNMGDLVKLGAAFDFARVAEAAGGGSPAAAEGSEVPTEAGERTVPVGKRYDGGFWLVDREEFQAYAAATDDDNAAYTGPDAVAPPMYHVRPFIGLMMKLATDPELELDLLRLVHGEHAMRFHRPLRHGDVLQLRGVLEGVQEKSSGRVASFALLGFVDGELALEGRTTYFIRGKQRPDAKKAPKPPPEPLPEPDHTVAQPVSEDQATRYAAASGDDNPIHVDPATAKAAGLPGVILHGLCTMAFAQRDLIRRYCDGDPDRLAALSVRFAKPVFPGETLTLKVWEGEDALSFVTENEAGKVVITGGRAEIR